MPFFWTQQGLSDVTIHGSPSMSLRPFKNHFNELEQDYDGGKIFCINLVDEKKKNFEPALKKRYDEMMALAAMPTDKVQYHYFNWHIECHNGTQPYYKLVKDLILPE